MGTLSKGPVFLFVLVIITNFLINLFSCDFKQLFDTNIYIKWIVGYLVMYFVVFLGNYQGHKPILLLALHALGYFIWFMALTKVSPTVFFIVVGILAVGFMADLYIEHHSQHPEEKHLEMYKEVHSMTNYVALGITIVGFAYYWLNNYQKVGPNKKDFSTLLFDTRCP